MHESTIITFGRIHTFEFLLAKKPKLELISILHVGVVHTVSNLIEKYGSPLRFWLDGNFMVMIDKPEGKVHTIRS